MHRRVGNALYSENQDFGSFLVYKIVCGVFAVTETFSKLEANIQENIYKNMFSKFEDVCNICG